MGRWGTGGSKAGPGIQCRIPSGGSGGQAREGFPGMEDGKQAQWSKSEGLGQDWDLVSQSVQ